MPLHLALRKEVLPGYRQRPPVRLYAYTTVRLYRKKEIGDIMRGRVDVDGFAV